MADLDTLRKTKPTTTQRKIMENLLAGRRWFDGRAFSMSAAGGWDRSFMSCLRHGWINRDSEVTEAGRAALSAHP